MKLGISTVPRAAMLRLFVFAVLLCGASLAALATAAEQPNQLPGGFEPSEIPGAAATIQASRQIDDDLQAQAAREQWLASPAAEAAREDSLTAYTTDDSATEAAGLLRSEFPEIIGLLADDPARVISELDVEKVLSPGAAIVSVGGQPQLLDTPIPLKDETEGGTTARVDLDLEPQGDAYETENALVDASLPEDLTDSVSVGEEISFDVAAAQSEDVDAVRFGDKSLLYPDAAGTIQTCSWLPSPMA